MSDLATKMIESCETKEKPHNLDKNQIMSYLSLLEKIYNKENCDKFHQERIFRITKALNSIKKYSNFKVSPFRLSKSSIPKEEQKVLNETENNTIKENEDEQKDIEDIMCMIEKELKLNGIDINNIENDSFISTNVKSFPSVQRLFFWFPQPAGLLTWPYLHAMMQQVKAEGSA